MVKVVDAVNLLNDFSSRDFLGDHGETMDKEDRRTLVHLLTDQVEFADVVILNKVRDAGPDDLPDYPGLAARRRRRINFLRKAVRDAGVSITVADTRMRPHHPNHIWSVEFVQDKLINGRSYKIPTVLDEYTRETPCVAVKPKMIRQTCWMRYIQCYCRAGSPTTLAQTMARSTSRQHCRTD